MVIQGSIVSVIGLGNLQITVGGYSWRSGWSYTLWIDATESWSCISSIDSSGWSGKLPLI